MKKILLAVVALSWAVGAMAQQSKGYVLRGVADFEGAEGTMVYLRDYHTGKPTDSCRVKEGAFLFCGQTNAPMLRRVDMGRLASANVIIEPGEPMIRMTPSAQGQASAQGSPLNDQLKAFVEQENRLFADMQRQSKAIAADSSLTVDQRDQQRKQMRDQTIARLVEVGETLMDANRDNMLGAYLLWHISDLYNMEQFAQRLAMLSEELRSFAPLEKKAAQNEQLAATSAGKPFVDFDAKKTDNTTAVKLSHYVGKGKWVLADFWASWCGPCIAELPNLKAVYAQYKEHGVEVLGINVWDKIDKCNEAIVKHELPWESIVVGDASTTEAYGINGIPHLILFAPDGTIAARGLRGEAVGKELDKQLAAAADAPKPLKKPRNKR